MSTNKVSQVGDWLRQEVRELPDHAVALWRRTKVAAAGVRSRAAARIAQRSGRRQAVDAEAMTKEELVELARKEDIAGRSSMTKAQLAEALRKKHTS